MYPALFTLYPSYEKTRGVRALQYSNGVRTFPLWCSHLLFDLIFIIISATICTIVIERQAPDWFEVGYLYPILVLYGLSATTFGYVISTLASSQLAAFAFAAGIQGVMFVLSVLAFTVSIHTSLSRVMLTKPAHRILWRHFSLAIDSRCHHFYTQPILPHRKRNASDVHWTECGCHCLS
jgi:hypothetical protein